MPILRIEAGMHTAPIRHIATDSAGRVALTCSDDKTARLWSLPSGTRQEQLAGVKPDLLRIFRPQIGEGEEGKPYSCALSPDGSLAAIAGWTGNEIDQLSIDIFNTTSGGLLSRCKGLQSAVLDLAFSPSGGRLGAVLGANGGLTVFDVTSTRPIANDLDYGAPTLGIDWCGENRLVTACWDGYLRLYDLGETQFEMGHIRAVPTVTLRPIAKVKTKKGSRPTSARFSPDGARIAVGFEDSEKVSLYDGTNLRVLQGPDLTGINTEERLESVGWSADGRTLAAAGRTLTKLDKSLAEAGKPLTDRCCFIRLWSKAGDGGYRDVPASNNRIMDLRSLPDGRFLFASSEPAWGTVFATTSKSLDSGKLPAELASRLGIPPLAVFREQVAQFKISAKARVLAFGFGYGGKFPATFDVGERQISLMNTIAKTPPGFHSPRVKGLNISDWTNQTEPKLDGKPLPIAQFEISRCLAIDQDAAYFLLGTEYFLRCFNANGTPRWPNPVPAPSVCLAVNLSLDGRIAVAAYGDGTIRWHRADNGKELLAFFPHADQKRWVLWSTSEERIPQGRIGAALSSNGAGKASQLMVTQIVPDSPAEQAGLKVGDQLISLDGLTLSQVPETVAFIQSHRPGSNLRVTYRRGDNTTNVDINVGESPEPKLVQTGAYYDASPGGEELIGWHVNQGADKAAAFYPASKFRDTFYRPDVISRVLDTLDVTEAVKLADAARGKSPNRSPDIVQILNTQAPPIVELLIGGAGAQVEVNKDNTTLPVRYRVHGGSGKVSRVFVKVDGRSLDLPAPIPSSEEAEVELNVPVPAKDCLVAVLAANRYSISEPAILRVRRNGPSGSANESEPLRGTLRILSVGVSKLVNQGKLKNLASLEYADADARLFAETMQRQQGQLYQTVETTVLENDKATATQVRRALEDMKKHSAPEDTSMFFLAGHGESDADGRYVFCTHDYDREYAMDTAVGFEQIKLMLATVKGDAYFFLDACSAGNALGGGSKVDINGLLNRLADDRDSSVVVFAASDGNAPSLESDKLKHGIFTQALADGLNGKADILSNGKITTSSLQTWLDAEVPRLSGNLQRPVFATPHMVPNRVLAIKASGR